MARRIAFPIWTWLFVVMALGGGALFLMPTTVSEHFNDYMVAKPVKTCPDGTRSQDGICLLEF